MSDVQNDLLALQEIQANFQRIKQLDKEIQDVKDEMDSQAAYFEGEALPAKPYKDDTKSKALRAQANSSAAGTYACLYTLCLIVAAVVALFIGLKHGALLAILGAGVAWIGGSAGLIGAVIGCALATGIGWKCWSHANTAQAIILALMAVGTFIFSYLYKKADNKDGYIHAAIKNQEDLEAIEFKQAYAAYEKTAKEIKKRNDAALKVQQQDYYDQIDELKARQKAIRAQIAQNPVLDDSDKKEEIVAFLISQIQRKRANSLSEALVQYDSKTEQERKAEIERLDRQLQADLERFNRDQQIRREADEQFNQAMHRLRVEKEQRRQTEELERIRRELER